jgi:hypothetical protein
MLSELFILTKKAKKSKFYLEFCLKNSTSETTKIRAKKSKIYPMKKYSRLSFLVGITCLISLAPNFLSNLSPQLLDNVFHSLTQTRFAEAQYGSNPPTANDDNATTPFETPVVINVLNNDSINGEPGQLSLNSASDCFATILFNIGGINAFADIVAQPSNGTITLNGLLGN